MKCRSWRFWLLTGALVIAVGVVGGPFVYIHFIEKKAPAPLALSSPMASATQTVSATTASTGVNGTWTATSGSAVGYRVQEVLFGQSNTASGPTPSVPGPDTNNGKAATAAQVPLQTTPR